MNDHKLKKSGKTMKKEMKFPPNGVDRISETKRIVAEKIR
jgi:hypothetical protein